MSRCPLPILVIVVVLVLAAGGLPVQAYTEQRVDSNIDTRAATKAYGSLPLLFVENRGQVAEGVRYYLPGGDRSVYLTDDAIWVTLRQPVAAPQEHTPWRVDGMRQGMSDTNAAESRAVTLRLSFPGANPHARLEPLEALETRVSYFIGNDPTKWRTDVPVWGGVRYAELYPGIDLEVSSRDGQWMWRVHARPDAELSAVQLRVEGAERLALEDDHLWVTTAVGAFRLPLLALDAAAVPSPVVEGMVVRAPFAAPGAGVAAIPAADRPGDLLYGTFLGGSDTDRGYDVAVDSSGNAYITGGTWSSNFPVTQGSFDPNHNGDLDVYVVKLNPDGTKLLNATFVGGNCLDYGTRITVDGSGNAYITGYTCSSNFPVVSAVDPTYNGGYSDAFVVKLNASGTTLSYSTLIGGINEDIGSAIAVDGSGTAYVTGRTRSSDFPITQGSYDTTHNGGNEVFVVKLNASGTTLSYSTFLGGGSDDYGGGIAVDSDGNTYITGSTVSSDFPTIPGGYDTVHNGSLDVFVVKLSASGTALLYATLIGGSSEDTGYDIALDASTNVYVTGSTRSSNFPAASGPGYDHSYNGGYTDAFAIKLSASGTTLLYVTFLGGSAADRGNSIAVDSDGNAYITGDTSSSNFPANLSSYDPSYNGLEWDAFLVKLDSSGTRLLYATFLGGGDEEFGNGVAVAGSDDVYITGVTMSSNFPAGPGYDTGYNGNGDAFVVKLATGSGETPPGPKPWLFLLYLAGDNNLYPYLQRAVQQLEAQSASPYVNIVVLFDGDRTNDTWRFLVQPLGNYTLGVNKWYMGELNMGDPQTLVNFITWARERYPAQYYYLAIADHGRGTTGIAWDEINNGDYLTTAELRTALSTATNSGQWKVNVLHYDTCLMALLENAYQVKDYVDYLVASQNLAWSAFAYATYVRVQGAQEVPAPYEFANVVAQVTASTTPRQLAAGVVDAYFNHPGVQGYPRTISALGLSRVTAVRQAVDNLSSALRTSLNEVKTNAQNARNATQKFDSRDYYRITNDDEYLDLYHFAQRIKQYVSVGDVQVAAQGVMDAIDDGFVVAERHQSGVWEGEEAVYWDLDNAHGVSIYFPPRSGSSDYSQYTNHQLFHFTAEGQWDEFLVDYFGAMGLPPEAPTAPGLPPMLAPDYKEVYLPVIMRSR